MKTVDSQIKRPVTTAGNRWTKSRRAVFSLFSRMRGPLSPKEACARLCGKGIHTATVYRCINLLKKQGVLFLVDRTDDGQRFQLSNPPDGHGGHLLVCQRCSAVEKFEDCLMEPMETRIGATTGFKVLRHNLTFYGICAKCG